MVLKQRELARTFPHKAAQDEVKYVAVPGWPGWPKSARGRDPWVESGCPHSNLKQNRDGTLEDHEMSVRVKCPNPDCRKAYAIASELAGKKVRCRACGQVFRTPASQEPVEAEPGGSCPECGAAMADGAIICVSCGVNVKSGEKIQTEIGSHTPPRESSHGAITDGAVAFRSSSIVNVWAAVDSRTVSWLQKKPREEAVAFAIQVGQVIADDIYPAIKEWMHRDQCFPTIVLADPFSRDNAVNAVRMVSEGGDAYWRRCIGECKSFLCRTGQTEFGGQVAIVVGCR